MKNLLVGQSGGPTSAINASLCGVIKESVECGKIDRVYGMVNGIEGFFNDKYIDLTRLLKDNDLTLLKSTPSSYLGSCRYKLPDDLTSKVYDLIFQKLERNHIEYFLYIGGNDSMDTVSKLSEYARLNDKQIKIMGVPKTIDNDLTMTDHTPGYGSVAKFVGSAVRNIIWDAGVYSQPTVTIVELMGRHAGWITAASVLARSKYESNPMLVYLPEVDFDIENFLNDIRISLVKSSSVVVCVSEGIHDKDGKYICEYNSNVGTDNFGHKMLTGCGKVLESLVKDNIGCKCRSIEVNTLQRSTNLVASKVDLDEAEFAGRFAVKYALDGHTGEMVSFARTEKEYGINYVTVPVGQVCNIEKKFPCEWIINGNDIDEQFLDYVTPLIQGEQHVEYENGLPKMLRPMWL